jgi:hypothetical protein
MNLRGKCLLTLLIVTIKLSSEDVQHLEMTPCSLVEDHGRSEKCTTSVFWVEEEAKQRHQAELQNAGVIISQ